MPTFTIAGTNLQSVGPVVEVQIAISAAAEATLLGGGLAVPPPVLIAAMIDTGSACTVVREGVAPLLGVQPIGTAILHTASQTNVRCYRYRLRLFLPNNVSFEQTIVEAPLKGQHIDCLIGRDVLANGVLVYIGPDNLFSLSF